MKRSSKLATSQIFSFWGHPRKLSISISFLHSSHRWINCFMNSFQLFFWFQHDEMFGEIRSSSKTAGNVLAFHSKSNVVSNVCDKYGVILWTLSGESHNLYLQLKNDEQVTEKYSLFQKFNFNIFASFPHNNNSNTWLDCNFAKIRSISTRDVKYAGFFF